MLLVQIADQSHPAVTLERWQGPEGLLEATLQAGLLGLRVALQWVGEQRLEAPRVCCEHPRLLGFLEGELTVPEALRLEVRSIRCLWRWSKAEVVVVQRVDPAKVAWNFSVRCAASQQVLARLGIAPSTGLVGCAQGLEWRRDEGRGQAEEKQKGARDGAV